METVGNAEWNLQQNPDWGAPGLNGHRSPGGHGPRTRSGELPVLPARLIARRENLHPVAQTTLFPLLIPLMGCYSDADGEPAVLKAHMRAYAHARTTSAGLMELAPAERSEHRLQHIRSGWWPAAPTGGGDF